MRIWVKRCLMRFNPFYWVILGFILHSVSYAKVEMSGLYIHLSDAMAEVKKGEVAKSQPYLTALGQEFLALPSNAEMGQAVMTTLKIAKADPTLDHLEQLAKALYAFEKAQNPIDYQKQRRRFSQRVMPIYETLQTAIQSQELASVQVAYKRFNTTWNANEKVVRETSLGHYGQIETAMTLLRIALLSEPPKWAEIDKQSQALAQALMDFNAGNVMQPSILTAQHAPTTLIDGIEILERSYQALKQNHLDQAQTDITLFIQQWAVFEGEVRTRDSQLYNRVESDLPAILVKGNQPDNLRQFEQLINDLKIVAVNHHYSWFDAMLILLREGIEALLIIMALLTTLNVAKQPKAKRWVYTGAGLGLFASIIGAVLLQTLFPALSAGTSREILEGVVGIVAVMMMLIVGSWLHSKSTVRGWKRFMDKHIQHVLATGSLFSMLTLSFLSVFREGAETILFYVGMIPLMSVSDLIIGIGLAILLLVLFAFIMKKSTTQLPIHHLFKLMTALIYILGFKILGVSVHALQLTQVIPRTVITELPNIPLIGFYASWQAITAQLLYLIAIPIFVSLFKK